jgi:hypothetical protein
MRNFTSSSGMILVMLAVLMPAPGHAESGRIKLEPDLTYTNSASQFQFPPIVGDFHRESSYSQFDREGRDIGVGYKGLLDPIVLTAFVYPIFKQPPNDTLEGHFATCKNEVVHMHDDVVLVSEGKVQVTPAGHKHEGLHAVFTLTDAFAHKRQPVRSELYLFTHGKWFVFYRVTYPVGKQEAAEPAIKAFINSLAWPEQTGSEPKK